MLDERLSQTGSGDALPQNRLCPKSSYLWLCCDLPFLATTGAPRAGWPSFACVKLAHQVLLFYAGSHQALDWLTVQCWSLQPY